MYPIYASAGFENAPSAASLWIRILCETGVIGLVLFAAFIVLFLGKSFGYMRNETSRTKKAFVAAGCATVIGILVQAMFCDFWSCPSLIYLLFVTVYIVNAAIRSGHAELVRKKNEAVNTECSATLEL